MRQTCKQESSPCCVGGRTPVPVVCGWFRALYGKTLRHLVSTRDKLSDCSVIVVMKAPPHCSANVLGYVSIESAELRTCNVLLKEDPAVLPSGHYPSQARHGTAAVW